MIKMNKLALCALLFSGLLSAVNGNPEVEKWQKMNSVELFNALPSRESCVKAFKTVVGALDGQESEDAKNRLLDLAKGLNFLCGLWEWLEEVDPKSLDMKTIFSQSASRSDLKIERRLVFLRDVNWGEGLEIGRSEGGDLKRRMEDLKAKCDDFI